MTAPLHQYKTIKGIKMKRIILISAISCALSIPALANIEQGIIAYEEGNLTQAVQLISQADDSDLEKHLYLAKISWDKGDLDKAERYIESALEMNESNSEVHFVHGKIMANQAKDANMFSKMGYAKDILKAFTAAVKFSPDNVEYRQHLLSVHIVVPSIIGGDLDVALEQAIAIRGLSASSGAIALMKVYAKLEEQEKYDGIYNRAVKDFPEELAVYYHRGMFYQQQQDFEVAVLEFETAAKLSTSTVKQRKSKYMAMYQIGRTSLLSKSFLNKGEQALNQYIAKADVQEHMPEKDWAKFRLANIIEFKGEAVEAKALYEELRQATTNKELKSKVKKRIKELG
jgi:tetratricopeptide (TPR) repeat protein